VLVQNGVLEGSRLAFRGSRARFSRVWGAIFSRFSHVLGHMVSKQSLQKSLQQFLQKSLPVVTKNGQGSPSAKNAKNVKNCQESRYFPLNAQNKRWALVPPPPPPWGGFNGIGAKLAILASQNFIFLQERQNEAKRYFKSASRTPRRP